MTQEQDPDRLLDVWFSVGPVRVDRRVVDEVAERIHLERQRPAWRLGLPKVVQVRVFAGRFASIAAVIAVILIGGSLLGRQGGIGGPHDSPLASATYVPTRVPIPSGAVMVQITFSTFDGKSLYVPSRVSVRQGATIYLDNQDQGEHDFSVEGTQIRIYTGAFESAVGVIDLPPGTYRFFSSVTYGDGVTDQTANGLEGTLTVLP